MAKRFFWLSERAHILEIVDNKPNKQTSFRIEDFWSQVKSEIRNAIPRQIPKPYQKIPKFTKITKYYSALRS